MPRFNSSYIHAYNNLYENWGHSAIDVGEDTRVFVEQNLFGTSLGSSVTWGRSIRTLTEHTNDYVWAERNTYYFNAVDRDLNFSAVPRNPPRSFYDMDSFGDIIDLESMSRASAVNLIISIAGWAEEYNDVYDS